MAEDANQYGEQLYSRMQRSGGLSKYQVDKVLALQRRLGHALTVNRIEAANGITYHQ